MKRKLLLDALKAVKPGIASKADVESMMYFYFSGTHVVTYNNTVSIQYPLKTNFSAFVKANDFFNFVFKVSSDDIETNLEGGNLHVKAGKFKAKIPTINDTEVTGRMEAIAKQASGLKWYKLPANFIDVINMCKFAASKNESHQTLTCLNIDKDICLAADNSRAAFSKFDKPMKSMFLKATEVKALSDVKPTGYTLNKSWLFFRNKTGCTFAIRSVQGVYPDFLALFEFDGVTVPIPDEVLEGVDVASIFTDEDTPKINLEMANGNCNISVQSSNGSMDFTHPIKYKGNDFGFSIDPTFLEEMMKHSTEIIVDDKKAKIISGDFQMVISLMG